MSSYTARELRNAAAIMDVLTKARTANEGMGVPTTPDVMTVRFPTSMIAVLRWVPGVVSDDPKRRRVLEQAARHRASYQVDVGAQPDLENIVALKDPQPATRGRRELAVELQDTDGLSDVVQQTVRESPHIRID
ncbi:hypothetical protein [Streptomyces sp. NBC_00847]|uniref:hypothetical protein n=1 Tax=Streptomyces sp. NBC_00847 TaxID=2975850 RepID=UPI00225DD890|nr:hypothetical protein [Streptomyces sp. NBC_00847]MCX4886057.1 hypothetical protein [Streptomyces sp. NBC_00847]